LINIDQIDRARELVRRDVNDKQRFLEGLQQGLLDLDDLRTRLQSIEKKAYALKENWLSVSDWLKNKKRA